MLTSIPSPGSILQRLPPPPTEPSFRPRVKILLANLNPRVIYAGMIPADAAK